MTHWFHQWFAHSNILRTDFQMEAMSPYLVLGFGCPMEISRIFVHTEEGDFPICFKIELEWLNPKWVLTLNLHDLVHHSCQQQAPYTRLYLNSGTGLMNRGTRPANRSSSESCEGGLQRKVWRLSFRVGGSDWYIKQKAGIGTPMFASSCTVDKSSSRSTEWTKEAVAADGLS